MFCKLLKISILLIKILHKSTKCHGYGNPWHNIRMAKLFLKSLIRLVVPITFCAFLVHKKAYSDLSLLIKNVFFCNSLGEA